MKLSLSDSHTYLAWAILQHKGIVKDIPPEMTNPELDDILRRFRKEWEDYPLIPGKPEGVRFLAKKCNHASSYGMQEKHMADVLGCTIAEARDLLQIKRNMAPKVAAWQDGVQLLAHRQGFLENPFGYRRAFFNVFQRDKAGQWRKGEEANKALAFLPQSTAAGMLRESLLHVWELPGCQEVFWPMVPIHDAILLETFEDKVEDVSRAVAKVMEREWPELGGLSIKVDVKVGRNWSEMH
jgi:DNA polymerase I-like protein with 3'-5' exonuclease and polymerase domains